jgi:hypothetical protein
LDKGKVIVMVSQWSWNWRLAHIKNAHEREGFVSAEDQANPYEAGTPEHAMWAKGREYADDVVERYRTEGRY